MALRAERLLREGDNLWRQERESTLHNQSAPWAITYPWTMTQKRGRPNAAATALCSLRRETPRGGLFARSATMQHTQAGGAGGRGAGGAGLG